MPGLPAPSWPLPAFMAQLHTCRRHNGGYGCKPSRTHLALLGLPCRVLVQRGGAVLEGHLQLPAVQAPHALRLLVTPRPVGLKKAQLKLPAPWVDVGRHIQDCQGGTLAALNG